MSWSSHSLCFHKFFIASLSYKTPGLSLLPYELLPRGRRLAYLIHQFGKIKLEMSLLYLMCTPLISAYLLSTHILLRSLLAVSFVDEGLWFQMWYFKRKFTHICSFPPDLFHCLSPCHWYFVWPYICFDQMEPWKEVADLRKDHVILLALLLLPWKQHTLHSHKF